MSSCCCIILSLVLIVDEQSVSRQNNVPCAELIYFLPVVVHYII